MSEKTLKTVMEETTAEVESNHGSVDHEPSKEDHVTENIAPITSDERNVKEKKVEDGKDVEATPYHDHSQLYCKKNKIEKGIEEVYEGGGNVVLGQPRQGEVWLWYLYEICSYFIHTVFIPVLFPLIMSQILDTPPEPARGWSRSPKGLLCRPKQMQLYESLTQRSIAMNNTKFSPLEWTSFSWFIGLFLAAPILGFISKHLDHGQRQILIAGAAIATGAFFCLPTGFFNVTWIFPPYIAAIVAANTVATASHTRNLGRLIKAFTGPVLHETQFAKRRAISSWLSLCATAFGCIGSAIIATFIYHMLRHGEKVLSLWVVSIFSGLKWAVGISHVIIIKPGFGTSSVSSLDHFFSIFKYPHGFGAIIVVFLSSFTTMCIFSGSVLYLIGDLCLKPVTILYLLLTYFIFPLISLPLMHPLQKALKTSSVKMHALGLFLSMATSATGFYFKHKTWETQHVLIFAAVQSTSVGLSHAYGRILVLDSAPTGKEGAFSAWLSWGRALGTFAGFAVATAIPGRISTSFGIAFCTAVAGAFLLIYGNVSDFGGAVAAGNVVRDSENNPSADGLESSMKLEEQTQKETP